MNALAKRLGDARPGGWQRADLEVLEALHRKVQWLSAWTIHHANHCREPRDGLKVGGHQASSASLAAVMTALYFSVLDPRDRVAVKPHASPVYHAIQYLLGKQSRAKLERFRALGGAQAYPSRTKDSDDVDFSTGSVGLGVAMTLFAALAQDYLLEKGFISEQETGRMVALLGDAELDEGNVHEALLEGAKHQLRNCWWIVDYNRQSLDAVSSDFMFSRYEEIFHANGWEVVLLKHGKRQQAAFAAPGGEALRRWIDECPNSLYSALTYKGGAAWREQLEEDFAGDAAARRLVAGYDDEALHALMVNLGGHDLELLLETFHGVASQRPHCFLAYTVKGWGLPFQGHKDNHAGLMTPEQLARYRQQMGIAPGEEWAPFAGIEDRREAVQGYLARVPMARFAHRRFEAPTVAIPAAADFLSRLPERESTQGAFGRIMHTLARSGGELARRMVTSSPDVTVSTNLGGWVNQRGIFSRTPVGDVFSEQNVKSMQKWAASAAGQHLELGIAENNLFLLLAAFGLTAPLYGQRLFPVGTLYDPFIARGLDAMNYACYQDARFMLVATPSGITLAPEGGAHQSINGPLIGMAQDGLAAFEPAYVDELVPILHWGFEHMQRADGGSVYLRLSTRSLAQPARELTAALRKQILKGGYWRRDPGSGTRLVIAYSGVVAPEAEAAAEALEPRFGPVGLLAVTSADRLHAGWRAALRARQAGAGRIHGHVERLLRPLAGDAVIVSVVDAAPQTLSWLGAVRGHRLVPLGVDRFGQSADIPDLYRVHGIDTEAISAAAAGALG